MRLKRVGLLASVFVAFTVGCGKGLPDIENKEYVIPVGALEVDSGRQGAERLAFQLAPPEVPSYSAQSLVHRWVKDDIVEYKATLKVYAPNGYGSGDYVDFVPAVFASIPQKGPLTYSKAVFTNLRLGADYKISVVARGNVGGVVGDSLQDISNEVSVFPPKFYGSQDIQDVAEGLPVVKVKLLSVPFSGSANLNLAQPLDAVFASPTAQPVGESK